MIPAFCVTVAAAKLELTQPSPPSVAFLEMQ